MRRGFSQTGFDAGALQAVKPGMPAIGSSAPPSFDPMAGCLSSSCPPSSCPPSSRLAKEVRVGALRDAIRRIEGHARLARLVPVRTPAEEEGMPLWSFGCRAMDQRLPQGLACDGVHEVKASAHPSGASAGDWMAGLSFALRLALRRQRMLRQRARAGRSGPWMLWCSTRAFAAEYGRLSANGLLQLGIDPGGVLIVETAREEDALQALEEGMRSKSLGLACGVLGDVALTPARRLSLAAGASETPCLLITHPTSPPTAATATRFTVSRQRSSANSFDPRAPGQTRFAVRLDRCRAAPRSAGKRSLSLEWCDETHSFSLAAGVAHRPLDAGAERRRAGG